MQFYSEILYDRVILVYLISVSLGLLIPELRGLCQAYKRWHNDDLEPIKLKYLKAKFVSTLEFEQLNWSCDQF